MSRVLLVDWLGRGGIAHTTGAWAETLVGDGHDVMIATRPGRELDTIACPLPYAPAGRGGRLVAHGALAQSAARLIGDWRPDLVVVQNFVFAPFEWPVALAARRAGARLVYVIHDHRLHSLAAGTRAGLRSSLRIADEVWAHTVFVANAIERYAGRSATVVPLPVPPALVPAPWALRPAPALTPPTSDRPVYTAVHFGVLKRGYKGTDRIVDLARDGVAGWRFHFLGVGAPVHVVGVDCSPGFVDAPTLVEAVERADATVLPYRRASQSAAVTLAQALGTVPIATAVGGIPEQIDDGVDGLLLPVDADRRAWAGALGRLAQDPVWTQAMARAGTARVWQGHQAFVASVSALADHGAPLRSTVTPPRVAKG